MLSEKMPMLMVLVILMNLTCTAYGGTECLRLEDSIGRERHDDCESMISTTAMELHISHVCDGNMADGKCHGSAVTVDVRFNLWYLSLRSVNNNQFQIVYCCKGKTEQPIVEHLPKEDNGSEKTKCTCEQMNVGWE